ncbi:MAG: hypothetical protein AAF582_00170 [Pseudomonadota bacterium]
MANIADCIDNAVQGGALSKAKGAAAQQVYQDLVDRYSDVMPAAQAAQFAKRDLGQATRRAQKARSHAVLNQLQSLRRINAIIGQSDRPDLFLQSMVEFIEGAGYTGESVASLQRAYITDINAGISRFLQATGRNVLGESRDKALLEDVIRELHLDDTGNQSAKDLADAIRVQQKRMREAFNSFGGDIGEIADFGVTHTHDPMKMRHAGFDAWRNDIWNTLDWSRIVDRTTDLPFVANKGDVPQGKAAQSADAMLRDIFDNVTSMGWDRRYPTMQHGGKALYNQRADARILHFKSGTDWLTYNKAFGAMDPFSSAIGGLHGLARDVALMRVLGPNPRAGFEYAAQVAQKRADQLRRQGKTGRNIAGRERSIELLTKRAATRSRAMLAHADGSANTPADGYEVAAAFFGGVRQFVVSTKLGAALLSSVTDLGTVEIAAQTMGMGGGRVLSRHVQLMGSSATRETALQMGYVADTLATVGAGANRFLGETFAPELTQRLADFTLRVSGLNYWTDMGRTAFKMEMSGLLGSNADRALADIDAPLRQLLEARGISAADWDQLRDPGSIFVANNGARFVSPSWFLEHTSLPRDQAEGLAMRLRAAIEEQVELAIPSVSLAGRAAFQNDARPGTFLGELVRSGVMFKSFVMSLMINQARRFWAQPTPLSRAAYAAKMMATMTLLGALAVQLKELSKGRDPRPMNTGEFWGAAVLQGGGVGIFGDFFAASTSRFGGGFAETLAGPVVGLAGDLASPIGSNIARAAQGDSILLGRDIANLVRYQTPAFSSLWYVRKAWGAMVADQLQLLLDPEADVQFRRSARRAQRDFGTSLWWEQGQMAPGRAPDLSNIVGGAP